MHDICVVGLGGSFYAYALERSGEVRVTAICRSNHTSVARDGLELVSDRLGISTWKPHRVLPSISAAADRNYRFVICAVKALPDVIKTSQLLKPILFTSETFVLIQNGIDIHSDLYEARSDVDIISSCCWTDSTAYDDGRKVVQSGPDGLTSGLHHSPNLQRGEESLHLFHDLLRKGGVKSDLTTDIDAARWRKVLWNAAISSMCTITRSSVADILSTSSIPNMLCTLETLMDEVMTVARAIGIDKSRLPDDARAKILDSCLNQYSDSRNDHPSPFKPSMLVDLERRRPIEVEVIVGNISRLALSHKVHTPLLDMLYAQLRVLQDNLLKSD